MSSIQSLAVLALSTLALSVAGCAQVKPTQTGFLSSYDRVRTKEPANSRSAAVNLSDIDSLFIEEVAWKVPAESGFDEVQRSAVLATLRQSLASELALVRPVLSQKTERTAVVRVAVTDAARSTPILNVLTTAAIFLPVANGGAAIEGELLAPDGTQRLAVTEADTRGLGDFFGFFVEKSHAMTVAENFARNFASKLDPNLEEKRSAR